MRIAPVTAPSVEPISLSDALLHLRLEGAAATADTTLITQKLTEARAFVEARSHRAFITQTYDLWLDNWDNLTWSNAGGYVGWGAAAGMTLYNNSWRTLVVPLPIDPVQSVTYVKYTDPNLGSNTWASTNYIVSSRPGRITPVQGLLWPVCAAQADVIQIRVVAGYGADGTTTPPTAISAIKLALSWLYENRSPAPFELDAIDALIASFAGGKTYFA